MKKTFFHISEKDLGETFKFTPRIPQSRAEEEDDKIPRVCAAPSITQCLIAIHGDPDLKGMYQNVPLVLKNPPFAVYLFSVDETEIYIPNDEQVPDCHRTGEIWITKAVVGERVGWINRKKLFETGTPELCTSKNIA